MNEQKKIVTRFAPSPTGFMHVGGVRTALYAYAYARKNNGTFILRIEDTDKAREVEGSIEHIIEALTWLGITWDEGPDIGGEHAPYKQSERLDTYKKYAEILIEKGYAYPDPYSEEELKALREQAEMEKRAFLFRDYRPIISEAWDGTKPLRFKVPEIKSYTWHDEVRGDLTAGEEALDDFILIKSDGYPTYNFAHIIDDLLMGVTHIMRADEFIASTPKFLSLYDALGITPPAFVTLPPILAPDGNKKLGKRDGAKDILEYRNEGYLPQAIVNFLSLLGWNPGNDLEIMTMDDIIEHFDISKIHKGGAMLDEQKLLWMNKEHMRRQDEATQLKSIMEYMPEYDIELLKRLMPSIIDRITTYGELASVKDAEFGFFAKPPKLEKEKLVWKDNEPAEAKQHLEAIRALLPELNVTTPETVKNGIMPYAEQHGKGNVLWPLRVSLSGQEKSVDPFTIIYVLGKEEVSNRLKHAIGLLDS